MGMGMGEDVPQEDIELVLLSCCEFKLQTYRLLIELATPVRPIYLIQSNNRTSRWVPTTAFCSGCNLNGTHGVDSYQDES